MNHLSKIKARLDLLLAIFLLILNGFIGFYAYANISAYYQRENSFPIKISGHNARYKIIKAGDCIGSLTFSHKHKPTPEVKIVIETKLINQENIIPLTIDLETKFNNLRQLYKGIFRLTLRNLWINIESAAVHPIELNISSNITELLTFLKSSNSTLSNFKIPGPIEIEGSENEELSLKFINLESSNSLKLLTSNIIKQLENFKLMEETSNSNFCLKEKPLDFNSIFQDFEKNFTKLESINKLISER